MPRANPPEMPQGLGHGDPRRPSKLRRLREEHARIAGFAAREPSLEDPEFDEWEGTVHALLLEVFGVTEFMRRFTQLHCRPIRRDPLSQRLVWYKDPKAAWKAGLSSADKLLREALEEGDVIVPPSPAPQSRRGDGPSLSIVVNNVFSPTVHVSVEQLFAQLDTMQLTTAEKAEASERLKELEAETTGAKRWPMIARSLEAIKSLGKGVYKDIAVPLIVEFLKRESGLSDTKN